GGRADDAFHVLEDRLYTPETSAGNDDCLLAGSGGARGIDGRRRNGGSRTSIGSGVSGSHPRKGREKNQKNPGKGSHSLHPFLEYVQTDPVRLEYVKEPKVSGVRTPFVLS